MSRLAIINCKAKKKDYSCAAEEMYSVSFQFRHQVDFIKEYYDDWAILSTQYGIITPDQVIDPYEMTLAEGSRLKDVDKLEGEALENWKVSVVNKLQELSQRYDEIDLHISNSYLDPIKSVLNNKIKHVKQPVNPGLVKNRYNEALEILKSGSQVDLNKIGEIRKSKDPEIERWWYHKEFEPFFGFARHLRKKYPIVDEGNATRVSRGLNFHTQGWVVNKDYLNQLELKNGSWRKKRS